MDAGFFVWFEESVSLFSDQLYVQLAWFNTNFLAFPAAVLFLGTAIILTVYTGFIQIRAFPLFIKMITGYGGTVAESDKDASQTISPSNAMFTALATTIGMGNVVGPTLAILTGGPGALVWLVVYMFFASVTKFTEVVFALHTRKKMPDGYVVGGPMEYLGKVHRYLAYWYGYIMAIVFAVWSGMQANTLASIIVIECADVAGRVVDPHAPIFSLDVLPAWVVGISLAFLVLTALRGGAKRVSAIASKLVPIMFTFYVSFALYILLRDPLALKKAIWLVWDRLFEPQVLMGSFVGATVWDAMRYGVYRAIHISEAGLGTSSIPHAMSDVKHPVDQGILAMGSTIADIILSILSGLLVLVTGAWLRGGEFRPTLVYEVFRDYAPHVGQGVLLVSISLFVVTTVMGNCFNGMQSFSALTNHRWVKQYIAAMLVMIVWGALMPSRLVWEMTDTLMACAAVPNLLGVLYLTIKNPGLLRLSNSSFAKKKKKAA